MIIINTVCKNLLVTNFVDIRVGVNSNPESPLNAAPPVAQP